MSVNLFISVFPARLDSSNSRGQPVSVMLAPVQRVGYAAATPPAKLPAIAEAKRLIVYISLAMTVGIVYSVGMTTTYIKQKQSALSGKARRRTLADRVIERIRQEIISARLAPGTMVAEIPTAQRLEVSRVPVREAMMVLEQDGLLVFKDNGRCRVRTLTARDFHEIYSIRLMLETESFRLAARNRSDEDLKGLRDNIRRMKGARTLNRVTVLDVEFHDQIMEMSRQSRLMHLWRVMRSQVQLFTAILQREITSVMINVREVSVEAHEKCLRGIESGDPELAGHCAIAHLEPWSAWLKSTRAEGSEV